MKRLLVGSARTAALGALSSEGMDARSGAVGHELSPVELDAVHGGALNIEVPAYVPLSQSHPKTEVVVPRVPYR